MAELNDLQIPREIPWKLASTTQILKEGFPDDTTISLFYYEPSTESLARDYPNERLIYLKFTLSISPCQLEERASELASSLLVGGLPVLHAVLDVAVTPAPFKAGVIRPYFHAAAPIRRSMIETGVVGDAFFEGESESLSFGKSASQLHETVSSQVTTKSKGWSLGLPGIAKGGKQTTSTTVGSEHSAEQYLENVNREASEERRELLSHMTHVENILTLLNAKHVGSPFLRFCLSPRPLRPLSIDPADPNLWYSQLLQQRSSGIEGIQEFFAIVAVPRGMDFCIQALLRRICVLDDPPVPPKPPDIPPNKDELLEASRYLFRKYPVGTPLDHLDVDLTSFLDKDALAPAIARWWFTPEIKDWPLSLAEVYVLYALRGPSQTAPTVNWERLPYKTTWEIHLEAMQDLYLRDLMRSPLERGQPFFQALELKTCFSGSTDHGFSELAAEILQLPTGEIPFEPDLTFSPLPRADRPGLSTHMDPGETVVRWNTLQSQLANRVSRIPYERYRRLSLNSSKVIQVFLRHWAKLDENDPRNLQFDRVVSQLRLTERQRQLLEEAGLTNLKKLAQSLLAVPTIDRQNTDLQSFIEKLSEKERCKLDQKPIPFPISVQEAHSICSLIGLALKADSYKETGQDDDRKDTKHGYRHEEAE